MTANAFLEDRRNCLDAGMNDHVSKPVDPSALYATLLRWLPLRQQEDAPSALAGSPNAEGDDKHQALKRRLAQIDDLDWPTALSNVGGNEALLLRLIAAFVKLYSAGVPALLQSEVPDAIGQWMEACHSLRGAVAALGGTAFAERLQDFEVELAQASKPAEQEAAARQLHDDLMALVAKLIHAIEQ